MQQNFFPGVGEARPRILTTVAQGLVLVAVHKVGNDFDGPQDAEIVDGFFAQIAGDRGDSITLFDTEAGDGQVRTVESHQGNVCAMERGDKGQVFALGEHLPREAENWSPKSVFIQHRYRTQEKWYDKAGHPFVPNCHYWVGGNTTFYGAALMRLRERDFQEVQHAGGVSPAWPITLADLAPYYAEAETLWRVHGTRGVDPTEKGDEPPYACRAIRNDPGIELLKAHWEEQGSSP